MKNALLKENVLGAIELLELMLEEDNLNVDEIREINEQIKVKMDELDQFYDEELKTVVSKTPSNLEEELENKGTVLNIAKARVELSSIYEEKVLSVIKDEILKEEMVNGYSEKLNRVNTLKDVIELSQIQYNETLEKLEYIKDDKKLNEVNDEIARIELEKAMIMEKVIEASTNLVSFEDLKTDVKAKLNSKFSSYDINIDSYPSDLSNLETIRNNATKSLEISQNRGLEEKANKYKATLSDAKELIRHYSDNMSKKEIFEMTKKDVNSYEELTTLVRDINNKAVVNKGVDKEDLDFLTKTQGYIYAQLYLNESIVNAQRKIEELSKEQEKLQYKKAYIEKVKAEEKVVVNNVEAVKEVTKEEVKIEYKMTEKELEKDAKPKLNINFEVKEVKKAKASLLEKIKKSKFIKVIAAIAAGTILIASLLNMPKDKIEEKEKEILDNTPKTESTIPNETIADVDSSYNVEQTSSIEENEERHYITIGDKVYIESNIDCFKTSGSMTGMEGLKGGEYNVNRLSITDKQGKILATTTDLNTSAYELASSLNLTMDDILVYPHLGEIDENHNNTKSDGFVEADKAAFDPTNDVAWVMEKDVKIVQTVEDRGITEGKVR